MAKINTMGMVETLNEKTINEKKIDVTANPGQLTVDYRKGNGWANITKVAGQAEFNTRLESPAGIITDADIDELKAYLDTKFDAVVAVINTII